jgi:hypothetical protein
LFCQKKNEEVVRKDGCFGKILDILRAVVAISAMFFVIVLA